MARPQHVAVIDIGKTNAKLAIVDSAEWQEIAVRTMPNRIVQSPPYPHFDLDAIWRFLLVSLKELNAQYAIDVISITAHGASAVLLNEAGELAMPMLDYEHDGPDTLTADYDAVRPPFAETGSPRLPMGLNVGAQLYWQMKAFPDGFARVACIVTYPQYWAYRLTGVMATEVTSLGCHTDLWNPAAGDFSTMVDRLDWRSRMAPVGRAGDVAGVVRPEIAHDLGLESGVQVLSGIHDSNASLYPHLLERKKPFSVVSTGTWVVSMAVGAKDKRPDPARDTLINVNALGAPVPSARFMGGREFDLLMAGRKAHAEAADLQAVLERKTMLLPAVESQSGPFQGHEARWINAEPVTDAERHVAVSFYLALMTAECLDLIGADGPTIVEGPFAGNGFYLKMLETVTGRLCLATEASATGTSIGAAKLASSMA